MKRRDLIERYTTLRIRMCYMIKQMKYPVSGHIKSWKRYGAVYSVSKIYLRFAGPAALIYDRLHFQRIKTAVT